MLILQIILLITPGIITTYIYKYKKKCNLTLVSWLYNVIKFALIIFWFLNVYQYLRGFGDFAWNSFSTQFILEYILITLSLVIILPHINLLLTKYSDTPL